MLDVTRAKEIVGVKFEDHKRNARYSTVFSTTPSIILGNQVLLLLLSTAAVLLYFDDRADCRGFIIFV